MSTRSTIAHNAEAKWHLFNDYMNDGTYLEWNRLPLPIAIPIPPEAIEALQTRENKRLRRLLAELVEAVVAYQSCGTTSTPAAIRFEAGLNCAIREAKEAL